MDVVSEQQRSCCLHVLDDLKTFESRFFTAPIHVHLKVLRTENSSTFCTLIWEMFSGLSSLQLCVSGLWTSSWINGSLPVVQSLLESLDQHLENLKDLRSDCREVRRYSICLDVPHLSSLASKGCVWFYRSCCAPSTRTWSFST